MIRLGKKRRNQTPAIMLSPMIDMIFLLLVFFILSTMYMTEIRTVPIKLPIAASAEVHTKTKYSVSIKKNGEIWLDDNKSSLEDVISFAKVKRTLDPQFSLIIRGDGDVPYKSVINVLDKLKAAGINKVGLAATTTEGEK